MCLRVHVLCRVYGCIIVVVVTKTNSDYMDSEGKRKKKKLDIIPRSYRLMNGCGEEIKEY